MEAQTLVEFEAGESVVTEHAYRYTVAEFAALARRAGFEPKRTWTDPNPLFSVCWLSPQSTASS